MDRYRFVVKFTSFQWPLRAGDQIEIQDATTLDVLGSISGGDVLVMLANQLATARLQVMAQDVVRRPPVALPAREGSELLPFTRAEREEFKVRRQTKRRRA